MKRLSLLLISILLLLIGCQKEKIFYSCNKDVNNWIVLNKQYIDTIKSRNTLLSYDIEYQKAIFRALQPEVRYSIWIDKIKNTLKLDWSNEEYVHLDKLLNNITLEWFDENYKSNKNLQYEKNDFLIEWISYGVNDLGWSKALVHSIAVRLDIKKSDNNVLIETFVDDYYSESNLKAANPTCKCSDESDWCDFPGSD